MGARQDYMRQAEDTTERQQSGEAVEPESTPSTGTGISVLAGAVLLVADNVGTGVLGLPGQAAALGGQAAGTCVIIAMAPLCWYMGVALHRSATLVEQRALLSDQVSA